MATDYNRTFRSDVLDSKIDRLEREGYKGSIQGFDAQLGGAIDTFKDKAQGVIDTTESRIALYTQRLERMKAVNAKQRLDAIFKRKQSEFAQMQAQQGLNFDYPKQIRAFQDNLLTETSDIVDALPKEDQDLFYYNLTTSVNNMSAQSYGKMEKQQKAINKEFLDKATIDFYNASNSRDTDTIIKSEEEYMDKLEQSYQNGFIEEDEYTRRKESVKILAEDARVDVLEDALNVSLFQEGDYEEAEKEIRTFMESKEFKDMSLANREKVFKLRKKIDTGYAKSGSLSGVKSLKEQAKKDEQETGEDFLEGDVSHNQYAQSNLKVMELRNKEIAMTKDPEKKKALARENVESLIKLNLFNKVNTNPKEFVNMTASKMAESLNSKDLPLLDEKGNFTEVGLAFKKQYRALRERYGDFKKVSDLNKFIEEMRARDVNGDVDTRRNLDPNISAISATALQDVKNFGERVGFGAHYNTETGRQTANVLENYHSRKYLKGLDEITPEEADTLWNTAMNFLKAGAVTQAGMYFDFLKAQGIKVTDVVDSQNISGNNIQGAIKYAGQVENTDVAKFLFKGMKNFFGNRVLSNTQREVYQNITKKIRTYVDKNENAFVYYDDKDSLVTMLTMSTLGALEESGKLKFLGSASVKDVSINKLIEGTPAVAGAFEAVKGSHVKVSDNVFIHQNMQENPGANLFANSLNLDKGANTVKVPMKIEGVEGNVMVGFKSFDMFKSILSMYQLYGRFEAVNERNFRQNTKISIDGDKAYLYEKNPVTKVWERLKNKKGDTVTFDMAKINKFFDEFNEEGAYAEDYKAFKEHVKERQGALASFGSGPNPILGLGVGFISSVGKKIGLADTEVEMSLSGDHLRIYADKMTDAEFNTYNDVYNSKATDRIAKSYTESGVYKEFFRNISTKDKKAIDPETGEEVKSKTTLKRVQDAYREKIPGLPKGRDVQFLTPEQVLREDTEKRLQQYSQSEEIEAGVKSVLLPPGSAEVVYAYDGDTLTMEIEHPNKGRVHIKGRLRGINTPEVGEAGAKEAKEFLENITAGETITYKASGQGKFGRTIVDLYIGDKNLNELLLERGFALEYKGDTRDFRKRTASKGLGFIQKGK